MSDRTARIDDDTRVIQWCEVIDVTQAGDRYRRWPPGRVFSRLVIPVPGWVARLAFRLGVNQ